MRLLYVSRTRGAHDDRFIRAWRSCGVEVRAVITTGDVVSLRHEVEDFGPDVVQAGPISSSAREVMEVWGGPMIAASWAFDLLRDVLQDDETARGSRAVLERADLVFVDSTVVLARAVELGADQGDIVQFPWGLEADWLGPLPPRLPRAAPVFLSTRRHEELYRVEDLVAAFIEVAAGHPDARLRLAGSGSLTGKLRQLAEQDGVAERVEFLGELEHGDLRAAFLSSDVYVSTSPVDGSSISLLEAMSCALPAVVTRIPGNLEWVDEETGFTFTEGAIDELAGILDRFAAADPAWLAEAERRAAAALVRVRTDADWPATVTRFPDYARRAIETHRRRGGADTL